MTTEPRWHYIYDPLCGWCYAVAPLVKVARTVMPVMLHGGGMMTGTRRQKITPEWEAHVGPNDRQITQVTEQVFNEAYLNGLLAVLDSEPSTAAMPAAEQVNATGLHMLAHLYEAHYLEGRGIADEGSYRPCARGWLGPEIFSEALGMLRGAAVNSRFAESREFWSQAAVEGFLRSSWSGTAPWSGWTTRSSQADRRLGRML